MARICWADLLPAGPTYGKIQIQSVDGLGTSKQPELNTQSDEIKIKYGDGL